MLPNKGNLFCLYSRTRTPAQLQITNPRPQKLTRRSQDIFTFSWLKNDKSKIKESKHGEGKLITLAYAAMMRSFQNICQTNMINCDTTYVRVTTHARNPDYVINSIKVYECFFPKVMIVYLLKYSVESLDCN